jgi:hypothetical protein
VKETSANFGYMLVGLILLWLMVPIFALASSDISRIALDITMGLALVLGAWSLNKELRFFITAAGITVLAVASTVIAFLTGNVVAIFLVLGLEIVFWLMCGWFVGRQVLAPGPVDLNRIAGGICIYMIAAVVWAFSYTLLNQWIPGSFNGLDSVPFEAQLAEMLYFSYVTLTTLGYGDMTPVHPFARWLAQVEAVFGQLYIAILIATLVGMWISGANNIDTKDDDRSR